MTTIQWMMVTNFLIFAAVFYFFESYIKRRAEKPDVFFLATEVKGFKIFVILLAISVLVIDYFSNTASMLVYAALFFSYAFNYKEIGTHAVVSNLRVIKINQIESVSLELKKKVYYLKVSTGKRVYELIIRESVGQGLEEAVKKLDQELKYRKSKK